MVWSTKKYCQLCCCFVKKFCKPPCSRRNDEKIRLKNGRFEVSSSLLLLSLVCWPEPSFGHGLLFVSPICDCLLRGHIMQTFTLVDVQKRSMPLIERFRQRCRINSFDLIDKLYIARARIYKKLLVCECYKKFTLKTDSILVSNKKQSRYSF